jgi:Helix-turn-helix of DDE superfamily endonuclease
MRFDSVKELNGDAFRRLTGIQRNTFEAMAAVLSDAKCKQKAAGGKPNMLSVENQLLMMFEYWREYRTYFHIGQAYGISESAAYRNIKWCENTLAKSKSFRLPGRKAVAASDRAFDVVLIKTRRPPAFWKNTSRGLKGRWNSFAKRMRPRMRRSRNSPSAAGKRIF